MLTLKNIKNFLVFILLAIGSFSIASCERLHLSYKETNYAEVHLTFDWEKCNGFTPTVSTVLFYKDQSKTPITTYITGNQGSVKLTSGTYSIIAFNGRPGDFSRLKINNLNSYSDINATAYLKSHDSPSGFQLLTNPDSLVVASIEHIEITESMIEEGFLASESNNCLGNPLPVYELLIQPRPTNVSCRLYLEVDRLHLVRSDGISLTLSGISQGVKLNNRINLQEKGSTSFDAQILLDKTNVNGYLIGHSFFFGFPEEAFYAEVPNDPSIIFRKRSETKSLLSTIYFPESKLSLAPGSLVLDVALILKDAEKTVIKRKLDASSYTIIKRELLGEIIIEINFTTNPENKIIIPDVIPEDEQGLTPNVGDWGNENIIDIPLIPKH